MTKAVKFNWFTAQKILIYPGQIPTSQMGQGTSMGLFWRRLLYFKEIYFYMHTNFVRLTNIKYET